MKLRIRGEEPLLCESACEAIENRIRLALGTRAGSIDSVELSFDVFGEGSGNVRCQLSFRDSGGLQTFVEEDAADPLDATKWVVWRMVHFLDRRALRER